MNTYVTIAWLTFTICCPLISKGYQDDTPINLLKSIHNNVGQFLTNSDVNNNLLTEDLEKGVLFYLFTRKNQFNYQQLKINNTSSVKSSNFDSTLPTTFIVHGYMDNIDAEVISIIRDNILEKEDQNVFGIDWSAFCMTILYNDAAKSTKPVGQFLGSFIEFLVGEGMDLKQTHLIGHSLGAHVSGFAGGYLTPTKPARVTGLDPALPGFSGVGPNDRLDASDADFVDCIHTCAGDLGMGKPWCKADFYPNGGENVQPGCPWYDFIGTCSHSRSYLYYAESVQTGHEFKSLQCAEVPIDGPQDECIYSPYLMGEPAEPTASGYFYVPTNAKYPFAKN